MALNLLQTLVFISIALFLFLWGEYLIRYVLKTQKWNKLIHKFIGFLVLVLAIGFLPNLLMKLSFKLLSNTGIIILSVVVIALSFWKFSKEKY